ncbi:uncharacterized protein LOC124436978 isoform X2 [Xenia sp. Carnegie-2017]|uniref:uncharacterized protein LOC124436978 isoform X2 n=1 Tax=Xenia sp. Carnegie-2017 TaxID=2897299 RepID=UPI001F04E375|nr:uncharacterized protein LOC124436978 isoform X2 [Xenia sp. Carnegie-2017]
MMTILRHRKAKMNTFTELEMLNATSRALDSVGLMRLQYKTSFIKSLTYPEKQIIIYVGFALHFEKRKNGYVLVQKESPLGGNL